MPSVGRSTGGGRNARHEPPAFGQATGSRSGRSRITAPESMQRARTAPEAAPPARTRRHRSPPSTLAGARRSRAHGSPSQTSPRRMTQQARRSAARPLLRGAARRATQGRGRAGSTARPRRRWSTRWASTPCGRRGRCPCAPPRGRLRRAPRASRRSGRAVLQVRPPSMLVHTGRWRRRRGSCPGCRPPPAGATRATEPAATLARAAGAEALRRGCAEPAASPPSWSPPQRAIPARAAAPRRTPPPRARRPTGRGVTGGQPYGPSIPPTPTGRNGHPADHHGPSARWASCPKGWYKRLRKHCPVW